MLILDSLKVSIVKSFQRTLPWRFHRFARKGTIYSVTLMLRFVEQVREDLGNFCNFLFRLIAAIFWNKFMTKVANRRLGVLAQVLCT